MTGRGGTGATPEGLAARPADDWANIATAIEMLRQRGAQRLDPVRFRHLEAMFHRGALEHGPTRRVIAVRLQPLLIACSQRLDERPADARLTEPPPTPRPSPLAALLMALEGWARGATPWPAAIAPTGSHPDGSIVDCPGTASARSGASPGWSAPTELKAVRAHRRTWSRLRIDQQMDRALKKVPDQAGPLNAQRLLHQALVAMRAASPDYAQHLMAQVETLLWLDRASLSLPVAQRWGGRKGRPGG